MGFLSGISNLFGGAGSGAAAGSSIGPWGTVAGAAIGALGSYMSQRSANSSAAHLASTAVRTRIADLRAAGLNPILAAQSGVLQAAQTPQQQSVDYSSFGRSFGEAFSQSTAKQVANQQMQQIQSNINLQQSQSASNLADIQVKQAQARNMDSQNNLINQQVLTEATRRANLAANTGLASAQSLRTNLQAIQDKVAADFWSSSDGQKTYRNNQMLGNSVTSPAAWSNVFGRFFTPPSGNSAASIHRANNGGNGSNRSSDNSWSFGPFRITPR